jgi:hypothetical protein
MNWNEHGLNEVLLRHFPRGTKKTTNNVRITDVPAETPSEHTCSVPYAYQRRQISFLHNNITKINDKEKLSINM